MSAAREPLRFFVEDLPISQGSGGMFPAGGKPGAAVHLTMTTVKLKAWRNHIARSAVKARGSGWRRVSDPVVLSMIFCFPLPLRLSRRKRAPTALELVKSTTPDLDKLVRAVGDALEAGQIIRNDSRIAALHPSPIKLYRQRSGCLLTLRVLDDQILSEILDGHQTLGPLPR